MHAKSSSALLIAKLQFVVPYCGKFSYGAKFRVFRIKLQDAKILTMKFFSVRNFENVKNFDSSMRSTAQNSLRSKVKEIALH